MELIDQLIDYLIDWLIDQLGKSIEFDEQVVAN